MRTSTSPPAILALAMVPVLLWGSSFVLTKSVYPLLPPLTVAAVRWAVASGFFALWLWRRDRWTGLGRALRREPVQVVTFGLVGVALLYAVQNLAILYTTAANASVLGNLVPIFVLVLAALFLKEALTGRMLLSVGLALTGGLLFSLEGGAVRVEPAHLLGDGLAVLAALLAAVYVVQGKSLVARHTPAVVTGMAAGVGTAFLLPLAWVVDGLPAWPGWQAAAALLVLGLGASAGANLAWWHVAARLPAGRAAIFILLVPAVGAGLGALFLGDPLTPAAVAGAGIILAGIYLAETQADERR